MTRYMQVTICVEVNEEEVRDWLARNHIYHEELTDEDYIEYTEIKYGYGLGAEARIL